MLLNYKYEIYPSGEQQQKLHTWINLCRQQYNSALLDKQHRYKCKKENLSRQEMQEIQKADKKKLTFLKEIPSQPLQEVFFRLDKAFQKFFRKEANYPKIKKYKDYNSLTFTPFGMGKQMDKKYNKLRTVRRAASLGKGGALDITKLGQIEVAWHRKLDGKVKQLIIKRQGNRWFAIFSVERHVNQTVLSPEQKSIGIDVGIKKFAVLSNGEEIENPTFLRKKERKLTRAQRKLSKKKKGSKNWYKQLDKVQKIHRKVANQRRDFLHRNSYHIAETYSMVCVEDLKIKNMVRNRKLAKSIHDAGWGMFRIFLKYKCEKNGGLFVKVKPHFTTQECSECGARIKKSLSVRTHICPSCGMVADRDYNAAMNIEKAGRKQLGLMAAYSHCI